MANIQAMQRRLMQVTHETFSNVASLTTPLSEAGLIKAGKKGGTHPSHDQRTNHLMHFLVAYTAPRKARIAEHVRRYVGIMPTFTRPQPINDPVIEEILAELAVGIAPNGGLIQGNNFPLGLAIEHVIDRMSESPRLCELMKKARFELEVIEAPPIYVPQSNFWLEHSGQKYNWHYSGAPQYSTHDGTEMPAIGPLVKSVRLGVEFFIAAAELWSDTKANERSKAAA